MNDVLESKSIDPNTEQNEGSTSNLDENGDESN
jgi:hypothetical protein